MRKVKTIAIIVLILIIIISSLVYFDYFNTLTNNTTPKLSIKEKIDENTTVYKAILYKVWYCKTNNTYTIGSYSDKDAICPKNYSYVDGYYTNENGVSISKRDLQMLTNDGVYTSEMIEIMNSDKQVQDSVHVAFNYLKNKYKLLKNENGNKIVILPEFKESKDGNYKWTYDETNENNLYCLKEENDTLSLATYLNEECGIFEEIKMDEKWCNNYTNSTLIYEEGIENICKE